MEDYLGESVLVDSNCSRLRAEMSAAANSMGISQFFQGVSSSLTLVMPMPSTSSSPKFSEADTVM